MRICAYDRCVAPPLDVFLPPSSGLNGLCRSLAHSKCGEQGGEILDPTCGDGVFLEAFIDLKKERGEKASSEQISRLYGIEIMREDKRSFLLRMKEKYSLDFPSKNFICGDILDARTTKKGGFFDWQSTRGLIFQTCPNRLKSSGHLPSLPMDL